MRELNNWFFKANFNTKRNIDLAEITEDQELIKKAQQERTLFMEDSVKVLDWLQKPWFVQFFTWPFKKP